ncbi:MAG: DUF480 domain-containing protein [Woeseiaceae bacterium]|nr:DUF480 domain-containing protein [Woeseiaceae bacterium]
MLTNLNEVEARIIGCLIEKSIITPDQYPMTLNALTTACNQKSSREPVMSLTPGEVQHTIRSLEEKHLARTDENFKSRAEKYSQRFCSTRYSNYQFEPAQVAVVCLLLLRGPQTPGELKARSGRLHSFKDNAEVIAALDSLINRTGEALVVQFPRTPGRKDPEYMHLFSGPVDIEAREKQVLATKPSAVHAQDRVTELTERVEKLEQEVAELKALLS